MYICTMENLVLENYINLYMENLVLEYFVEQKNGILKNIVFKYMQKSMIFKNYILLCAELEDQQKNSIFQNYFCSGFGF